MVGKVVSAGKAEPTGRAERGDKAEPTGRAERGDKAEIARVVKPAVMGSKAARVDSNGFKAPSCWCCGMGSQCRFRSPWDESQPI